MINLLITMYCTLSIKIGNSQFLTFGDCQQSMFACIDSLNQSKYRDSFWLDVPNEKMSVESLNECILSKSK